MKVLRVLGNVLIGILLFVFIFGLTFIVKTKNFLENDLLHGAIGAAIEEAYKDEENVSDSQKELIDNMFEDKEASGVINMVLDNYREYKNNSNYQVSQEDAKKLYDFVAKYKDKIYELSGEDVSKMSDKEFEEFFDYNKINDFAHEAFSSFDNEIGEDGIDKVVEVYSYATSGVIKSIFIASIIVCILFLMLINWSLIKWALVTGVTLIISGVLMSLIYLVFELLKNNVDFDKLKVSINLGGYLVAGIIEIVFGIVLIVAYELLNKKLSNSKLPNNTDVNVYNNVSNIE